jgi:hypothetical protein
MRKLIFLVMIALIGISKQVSAADIVNNTSCPVTVQIVFYNPLTCNVTGTCSFLTIAAHSTVVIPTCISSTTSLLGFEICWALSSCTNCVSIGNSSGPYPCPQFPAGPVTLFTNCSACSTSVVVTIAWSSAGDLIIG